MRTKSEPAFRGSITLGLKKGYTEQQIDRKDVYKALSAYQKELWKTKEFKLSVRVSDCDIVFNDQLEPHLRIDIINYPLFPASMESLRQNTLDLAEHLLVRMEQNRVVVEFDTDTVMLDLNDEYDPRVKSLD